MCFWNVYISKKCNDTHTHMPTTLWWNPDRAPKVALQHILAMPRCRGWWSRAWNSTITGWKTTKMKQFDQDTCNFTCNALHIHWGYPCPSKKCRCLWHDGIANVLSKAQIAIPNLDDGVLKRVRQEEKGKGQGKGEWPQWPTYLWHGERFPAYELCWSFFSGNWSSIARAQRCMNNGYEESFFGVFGGKRMKNNLQSQGNRLFVVDPSWWLENLSIDQPLNIPLMIDYSFLWPVHL